MSKKRRISVRIHNDEAVVVAPIGFWEGVERLFRDISIQPANSDNHQAWVDAADHVSYWVEKTKPREDPEEW